MKKVIAFILFTVMILGLYGCHIFNGNDGNGGNGGNDGDDLDNQNPPASDNQLDLPENEVNVIIIAGQSNAEGNSNMSNLDKYCADNGYDFSQFVYGFEDVKISFHHHFYYADLNAYVTDKIDPFNTNFVDVKVGQGCAPKHSGPELGLAQVLHENVESTQPIYIIRYASGGTPFTGSPSWKSPSSGETGLLYSNLITYVNDGLENLKEQGLAPKVRAFVWMQGEADGSNANAANAYKNNMKNMMRILAVVSAMALASCQKPFEKHYDLSVDSNAYVLPYTGDTFPVYVYCSGEWTAEFDVEADWIRIVDDTDSGKGTGVVRITYRVNDDAVREVNLILRSGEFTQTVNISQKYNSTHLEIQ